MRFFETKAVRSEDVSSFIPVIDVERVFAGDAGALERAGADVRRAGEGLGFFYLAGHGVPQAVVDDAFSASRELFAMSLEEKNALQLDENRIGYLRMQNVLRKPSDGQKPAQRNRNESFFISHDRGADHPDVVARTPLRGTNQWPEGRPHLRAAMVRYFDAVRGVGAKLLPVLARALEMPEGFFAPLFHDEPHIKMRFLHYPPQAPDDDQYGQSPHSDNGFLTILARERVPGLAIHLPDGEWLAPPVLDGTFLVNFGDLMKRWSNDRFHSTEHGVVNDTGVDRYSIPCFFNPSLDTVIDCLPTCVGAENPARYPRAVYRDLLNDLYSANAKAFEEQGRRRHAPSPRP